MTKTDKTAADTAAANAADTGTETPATQEQIDAALKLTNQIKELESTEATAIFAQSRVLREVRDLGAWKLVEGPDGTPYTSFAEFLPNVTKKSAPTVSQNISVVTHFDGFSDEELAKAGRECLYVAYVMQREGIFATTKDALNAAQKYTRAELMSQRSSGKVEKNPLVYLSAFKVTQAQANNFEGGFEKFQAMYTEVHGSEGTLMQVVDFFNTTVSGLPLDFIREAAQGQGGAAPTMEGGYQPVDVPMQDVIYFLMGKYVENGQDPQLVIDAVESAAQSYRDRFEIEEAQRKADEKAKEKEAGEREKAAKKWSDRLTKVVLGQLIDFADGSQVEVVETNLASDGTIDGVWVRGKQDGRDLTFAAESTLFPITKLVSFTIVQIGKAPKPQAVKAPKGTKAASEAEAKSKSKAKSDVDTGMGMSKAQQAGKGGKGRKLNAIDEGTLAPE